MDCEVIILGFADAMTNSNAMLVTQNIKYVNPFEFIIDVNFILTTLNIGSRPKNARTY